PRRQRCTETQLQRKLACDLLRRRLDTGEPLSLLLYDKTATDRDGAGRDDAALVDQRKLGGAAADIHVEERCIVPSRERDGAGAMRRHLALHMVAGRGADEFTGLFREEVRDRAGVAPLEGFAGENDGAAVNLLARDPGEGVATADEARQLIDVDGVIVAIGREQDGRLPQDLALHHDEAAR